MLKFTRSAISKLEQDLSPDTQFVSNVESKVQNLSQK